MSGTVEAIFIATEQRGGQQPRAQARLVAGGGIEGDRYFGVQQSYTGWNVTLVEAEEIERYNRELGQSIGFDGTRRNIVTRGVRLNDLVGREFNVGAVRLRGVRLCEPCKTLGGYLESQGFSATEVIAALVHRAGLRADVLSSGVVRVGDGVTSG